MDEPANTVTDQLRRDVLSGKLAPGDRLLELQLADDYQCGRAAIRSAIIELTSEGLVDREANRGATVRRITVDDAIQITQARAALESLIAAEAAKHATPDDLDDLARIVSEMEAAVTDERSSDYSDLNRELHRRLREVSGHAVAGELVANLRNRAAHHQYRLAVMPGRPNVSLGQHRAIVAAVVERDSQAAAAAMRDHLESVIEVLQQWGDASGS